ncbi:hypothetical protein ENTCAN_05083 [Enterobacter cancerogenus ATCC 35316]|nr:hypothetical protein ENTCAN_05083 [Enterobacter cancerogenus ATCC 35316]
MRARPCGLMPSPRPSPTGEGANTKNRLVETVLLFILPSGR